MTDPAFASQLAASIGTAAGGGGGTTGGQRAEYLKSLPAAELAEEAKRGGVRSGDVDVMDKARGHGGMGGRGPAAAPRCNCGVGGFAALRAAWERMLFLSGFAPVSAAGSPRSASLVLSLGAVGSSAVCCAR